MPSGSAAQPLYAPPPHHPPRQSQSRRCALGRSWHACLALRLAAHALTHALAKHRNLCARGRTAADASAAPALTAHIVLLQEACRGSASCAVCTECHHVLCRKAGCPEPGAQALSGCRHHK